MRSLGLVAAIREMIGGGPALWLAGGEPPALPDGVGAVVATSGSTGAAKAVTLSREALRAAGEASRAWAGRDLTWHLSLEPSYVAGLMVVVRAAVVDRPVIQAAPDLSELNPSGDGDAISLVPTQLYRALQAPTIAKKLAAMDLILVGGAALDDELRTRAEEAGLRLVETYGMSETCGGVVLDGQPLPGVEVRLDEQQRIWLRTPTAFDGYWEDPAGTAEVLQDGWIRTSDRGAWRDARLTVTGRVDDVVISGGINIDLAQLRAQVRSFDADAEVLAVPDREWGSRIVVFSALGDLAWWREALAETLPRTWLPRQHVALTELPRTAGGKPDRAKLQALALT